MPEIENAYVRNLVDGLRGFADWLEANADLSEIQRACESQSQGAWWMNIYCIDRDELATVARALGRADKGVDGKYFKVSRRFGPIDVYGYTDREHVCRKVVKGVRTVSREVPDPEKVAALPTVTVTEQIEDVEWICEPSLLAATKSEAAV